MTVFNAGDVLQFAIRIEENGEKFYRDAEKAAKDEVAKQLFKRLANEEVAHKAFFQKMYEQSDCPVGEFEDEAGEYMSYLRTFIDGRAVFEPSAVAGGDVKAILDAAIQRELNSVLYYEGLKESVSDDTLKLIDDVIAEERRHFAMLSDLKRSLK